MANKKYVLKVNNTEPDEFGNVSVEGGGTTGESYIEVTKSELDTHITNSTLVPGVLYAISGVDTALYGGTTVYLRALTANSIETKGTGKFYNPKYNPALDTKGIYLDSATATALGLVPKTYVINDTVIWGGKHWKNLNGNLGDKIDDFTLNSEWEVIPFNSTDYNVVYDDIRYDYANNLIVYRADKNGNEIDAMHKYGGYYYPYSDNPIRIFQWGRENWEGKGVWGNKMFNQGYISNLNSFGHIFNNTLDNSSIRGNLLTDSGHIFYNNLINSFIIDNIISEYGTIENNYLFKGIIENNKITDGEIKENIINEGSITYNNLVLGYIEYNIINVGLITNNDLYSAARIGNNHINNGKIRLGQSYPLNYANVKFFIINNGDIGGNMGIDLSSSTLRSSNFTKEVFKNSAGVTKIKYIDGSGATIIANLTD